MKLNIIRFLPFVACLLLLSGCNKTSSNKFPKIKLGYDSCTRCGMIISEDRFASGYLNSQGKTIAFDDLAEAFEAVNHDHTLLSKMYVAGMKDLNWIPMSQAHFVHVSGFATPMGFGVVAFEKLKDATAFAKQHGTLPKGYNEMQNHLNRKKNKDK